MNAERARLRFNSFFAIENRAAAATATAAIAAAMATFAVWVNNQTSKLLRLTSDRAEPIRAAAALVGSM